MLYLFPGFYVHLVFLKKAKIVRTKGVGAGISKPLKVCLERDGVRLNAIYKNIDKVIETTAKHGSETAEQSIDSYKAEIAAWELDKLLDLQILPATGPKLKNWLHTVWMFDYLIYNSRGFLRN